MEVCLESNGISVNLSEDEERDNNEEEEEEEEEEDNHKKPLIEPSSISSGSAFFDPLSVGKIKIYEPRRRRKRWTNKCYSSLACFLLLGALLVFAVGFDRQPNPIKVSKKSDQICGSLNESLVWYQNFPMFTVESALRLIDVNNDSVLDIIVAFGTGADAAYYPALACQIYFNQTEGKDSGCGGGVMALDGRTGSTLWLRYTRHEIFAVNCNLDITRDGVKDCVVGGRMATLYAIDGTNGSIIWTIPSNFGLPISETSNFYTPLYISKDLDEDGLPDMVLMHGGDPLRAPGAKSRLAARLLIVSSGKGSIISWSLVPDKGESYYSPQQLTRPDGSLMILFGTGGETHSGSLYAISLNSLLRRQMNRAVAIYTDCCKGIMGPPVLVDLSGDEVLDIVMSLFNSTVIAFDGMSFDVLWKKEFPGSETYSTPAVGMFNNDSTPDLFVIYQKGPGFPVYYYTQATVLDGNNGQELLPKPIQMLVGTQSSPITISTYGVNDVFLFWLSSCSKQVNISEAENLLSFHVMPGTNVHDASRADFCQLRFNSTTYTKFIGLSPQNQSIIYDSTSSANIDMEKSTVNYTELAEKWLQQHSDQLLGTDDYSDGTQNQGQSEQEGQGSHWQPIQALSDPVNHRKRIKRRVDMSVKRIKRHVGMHDGGGIQRVISTGTLAPSTDASIDVVFATYWFPASGNVKLMSPRMRDCVDKYMSLDVEARVRLFQPQQGLDHDAYEEAVNVACVKMTGETEMSSKQKYNLFGRTMGSMTVYRKRLQCEGNVNIRPFEEQIWPSYLGADANSVANLINI